MAILVLAANTSFADFPRLSYFLSRDRFMPRQFGNIGDRLVFSNGIIVLAMVAAILVIAFHASVTKLIPLYAVGVFLAFTLSQAGMFVRSRRLKEKGAGKIVSLVGAIMTGIVTVIQAYTKFWDGAVIVVVLIVLLVYMFRKINQHYMSLAEQLRLPLDQDTIELPEMRNTVIVLVSGIHNGILPALQYAKSLSPDCRGVYIETEAESTPLVTERWDKYGQGIPLVILESPYRSVIQPIMKYLDEVKEERTRHIVTVVVPEFVPAKWWHQILHGQSGLQLKYALLFRRDIVVANIRYYLEK
jgi:cbb3-type cytochrome oxidase subunit 3